MLKATLLSITAKLKVTWPDNFKEDYASQEGAHVTAGTSDNADSETGKTQAAWLAESLQDFDALGLLLDAKETSNRQVLTEGVDATKTTIVMQLMNSASSKAPSYATSCRLLDLDPANPVVGPVKADPHQVTGAAWACCMICVLRFALRISFILRATCTCLISSRPTNIFSE